MQPQMSFLADFFLYSQIFCSFQILCDVTLFFAQKCCSKMNTRSSKVRQGKKVPKQVGAVRGSL